ncbi:MAG: hypothetical protein WBA93_06390 [Microcoleaceae cyanobacterium]
MIDKLLKTKPLLVTAAASVVSLFGIVSSAKAFTLLREDIPYDNVTGIENLDVNGTLYDVYFELGDFDGVFDGVNPTFLGTPDDAMSAAKSINDALGTNSFPLRHVFAVPYSAYESFFGFDSDPYSPLVSGYHSGDFLFFYEDENGDFYSSPGYNEYENLYGLVYLPEVVFPVFTPVSMGKTVPEPSLILGFIALSGLMLGSTKKAQN